MARLLLSGGIPDPVSAAHAFLSGPVLWCLLLLQTVLLILACIPFAAVQPLGPLYIGSIASLWSLLEYAAHPSQSLWRKPQAGVLRPLALLWLASATVFVLGLRRMSRQW